MAALTEMMDYLTRFVVAQDYGYAQFPKPDENFLWDFESHNLRARIWKLSEKNFEDNMTSVLKSLEFLNKNKRYNVGGVEKEVKAPIKLSTRVPNYNGIKKILTEGAYHDGHGYIPVVEEEVKGNFIDQYGNSFNGLTVAWFSEEEYDEVEARREEIKKSIRNGKKKDTTNYINKLKENQIWLRPATQWDSPRISELFRNSYKKWFTKQPLMEDGVKEIIQNGAMVIAEDRKKNDQLIGCAGIVPETKANTNHYESQFGKISPTSNEYELMSFTSNEYELTHLGLNPDYIGKGVFKGMHQYLSWMAYDKVKDKKDKPTIRAELIHPYAVKSLEGIAVPIGGESPTEPKEWKCFELSGVLMRAVTIIPQTGLLCNSPMVDLVDYRLAL